MWKPFVDCKPNRKMFQLSKCFIKNRLQNAEMFQLWVGAY